MLFFSRFTLPFNFRRLLLIVATFIFLPSLAYSAEVTLGWDPNMEPDLAGYKVYYGSSSRGYEFSIDVDNTTTFTVSTLENGRTYYFAATAYDTSDYESEYSNEVVYNTPLPCTYSISPTAQSFTDSGGADKVSVTTPSGCSWTAVSNASWLVITSNSSAIGNGMINYSVLYNPDVSKRTGTLTVAGQSFTVTQEGKSPSTVTITATAGSNGSISPQGKVTVNYGGNQTFTIIPKAYYRIADVKVNGVSQGAITSYTFKNVTSNHSIRATFVRKGSRWW